MDFDRRVARSVAEYVDIVSELGTGTATGLWFRGQSDSDWTLQPGLLRDVEAVTDGRGRPVPPDAILNASGYTVTGLNAERMRDEFKRRARGFLQERPANDFEWMFVAQHHGLPTRLLDWSTNALVALYFAAEFAANSREQPDDACGRFLEDEGFPHGFAVFVIDPRKFNEKAHDIAAPIDISANEERWRSYLDPMSGGGECMLPICITAPLATDRIRAQSGVFTLHGSQTFGLDYYNVFRGLITKIFVPGSLGESFRQTLAQLGMTRNFIYPGLDALAIDIKREEQLLFELARSTR